MQTKPLKGIAKHKDENKVKPTLCFYGNAKMEQNN